MSWELGSFAVLAVVLAAGFAWWERERPPSRVLALVATLAAMAALGRVAFAPLPNVKPTTDIALLSGFVLGPAPGFAIGAIGALASNLVFGQGPWTPWQMAAWGLCGAAGGVLGVLTGRRMGRVALASVCFAAGLAYGAILDYSTWATFSGSHTLAQYVVIAGTSLPFNLAHAVGNAVFCLAFGPAFVRALLRFRARFEIRWLAVGAAPPRVLGVVLTGVVVAGAASGVGAAVVPARADASARSRAVGYLLRAQNRDGGFGAAPGQPSAGLYTSWAAIGLAAAGRDPDRVRRGGATLGAALEGSARRVRGGGDVERTILGLRAAGHGARSLAARMRRSQSRAGSWGGLVNLTSFGVLALRAAGESSRSGRLRRGASWIAARQHGDGGFNFGGRGGPSTVDDTAAAVQALRAARRSRTRGAIPRALRFLRRRQNRDGGFGQSGGAASNAQSTAWAVQAFVAGGRSPDHVRRRGSSSPIGYLSSLVTRGGAVRYSRSSAQTPVWVTAQAIAALYRRALPIRGR